MVGSQAIQPHLVAIRMIFVIHRRQGLVTINKIELMTDQLKDLIRLVGKCKKRVMKVLCKERLDGEFLPFMLVEQIPRIEGELWKVGCMKQLGRWSNELDLQPFLVNIVKLFNDYSTIHFYLTIFFTI